MNEKVTFQELIEAISDQSEYSKQYIHDFLKDLVSVINEGLETEGKVNIAGFGKFELKKMGEREGYNPQTGEKMTIPEHNKVVFKPYKELRELVNAPYAHLDSELIEEEQEQEKDSPASGQDLSAADLAPAPPPAGAEEPATTGDEGEGKAPWEADMEAEAEIFDEEDPFGIDAKYSKESSIQPGREEEDEEGDAEAKDESTDEDGEDVVEYTPAAAGGEEIEIDDVEGAGKDSTDEIEQEPEEVFPGLDEEQEEPAVHEVVDQEDFTHTGRMDEEKEEKQAETTGEERSKDQGGVLLPKTPSFSRKSPRDKQQTGSSIWIIAAAFIILLIMVSGWYFMAFDQQDKQKTAADNGPQQATTQPAQPNRQTGEAKPAGNQSAKAKASNEEKESGGAQKTTRVSQQSRGNSVKTITVAEGQTLWGLADRNYRNPRLWPWIYNTNQPEVENPHLIYTGQKLNIPLTGGRDKMLTSNDSLQVAIGYVETYRWYKENGLDKAKFYLYTAKKYHDKVLQHIDVKVDDADLAFANRHH